MSSDASSPMFSASAGSTIRWSPSLTLAGHAHRGQGFDLCLRQRQGDLVVLDPYPGADRDRDLALSPQMPVFEHEMRDVVFVDHEAVHLAEEVVVGCGDRARASNLDLAFRH